MSLEQQLKNAVLDAPCQIGLSVYHKGVPVLDVIRAAQRAYRGYKEVAPEVVNAREARWHDDILREVQEYQTRTKTVVELADLYDAFLVQSFKDIEPEDRDLFIKRVRARMV